MIKKVCIRVICSFVAVLALFLLLVPFINDCIAKQIEEKLCETPLPVDTEIVDSVSMAGKLAGNGNGMQYFGAVLLKSELSLEELDSYYSAWREMTGHI